MWGNLIPVIGNLIDKIVPNQEAAAEAKLKALELAQRGEFAELDAEMKLALGQIEVNKQESASSSLFIGGWRPGAGWVCVAGLLYTFFAQPLLAWLASIYGWPVPPKIDMDALMVLLTGMLGLGGYRSFEKTRGVAR